MKRFRSLRGQLTLAIVIVVALGIGLLFLLAGDQIAQMTTESFTREQQVEALVIANTLSEPSEYSHAQDILTAWMSHRDRWTDDPASDTNIMMFNVQGALIASSLSPQASTPHTPVTSDFNRVLSGGIVSKTSNGRLFTDVPVVHQGREVLGVIQLDSSLSVVNSQLTSRWLILLAAAGVALMLAILAALWLSARLAYPLSELHIAAKAMSEGELDARAEVDSNVEELKSLGAMFNHMAEEIENMMQKQRDFVANASHELRSPLAAIKLRAEALEMQSVDSKRGQQYASEINEEVTQLAQLVTDLLHLSRAESGVFSPPEEPIHVADELNACIRTVEPHLTAKHEQFEVQIADDLPDLYIHPNDMRIMVGNLLDNAIKYTSDGGKISLSAVWQTDALEIAICDNGEGIPPKDLARISDRFFRVDRAHTRTAPGVGLGLALVAAIARQYKGTLRIESQGIPGQGTQAYLRLPQKASLSPQPAFSHASGGKEGDPTNNR